MYFSRYIWVCVRRIYFKAFKQRFKLHNLSKMPLTNIPHLLKSFLRIKERKYKAKQLTNIRELTNNNLLIKSIHLKYNLNCKYFLNFKYSYHSFYDIYFFFNYFKVKRYIQHCNRKLRLHNGRYYYFVFSPQINLTLSVLTETVTYGMRKKKKKKK